MWKIKIKFQEIDYTHEIEDQTKIEELYGENYVEDRINDYLVEILDNELNIFERVEESEWDIDYKVYDSNNNELKY